VQLLRRDDTYLLDVADHDLSTTPYLAGARAPGQGGFGLQIARRLAVDVGWYAGDLTKHVWARFPVAPGG
jgi:serine/threonine-protein kinase RsbW